MQIDIEKSGEVAIVTLQAEHLDASAADEFKQAMQPILDANHRIVLDMSPLRFVDSAGLGAILSCLRKLSAAEGDLKLCGLSKPVRSIFEISRMHRIFDILPTRAEAVQAFQTPSNAPGHV